MTVISCNVEEIELYVDRFNAVINDSVLLNLTVPFLSTKVRGVPDRLLNKYLASIHWHSGYYRIPNRVYDNDYTRFVIGSCLAKSIQLTCSISSKNVFDRLRDFLLTNNGKINKSFVRDLSCSIDEYHNDIHLTSTREVISRKTLTDADIDNALVYITEFRDAIQGLKLSQKEYESRLDEYLTKMLELSKSRLYNNVRREFIIRKEDLLSLDGDAIIASHEVAQSVIDIMKL